MLHVPSSLNARIESVKLLQKASSAVVSSLQGEQIRSNLLISGLQREQATSKMLISSLQQNLSNSNTKLESILKTLNTSIQSSLQSKYLIYVIIITSLFILSIPFYLCSSVSLSDHIFLNTSNIDMLERPTTSFCDCHMHIHSTFNVQPVCLFDYVVINCMPV